MSEYFVPWPPEVLSRVQRRFRIGSLRYFRTKRELSEDEKAMLSDDEAREDADQIREPWQEMTDDFIPR